MVPVQSGGLSLTSQGDIAVIVPLENAPNLPLTDALPPLLDTLATHPGITALVLRAGGAAFAQNPVQTPRNERIPLTTLCDRIEALPFPVIAALDGPITGPKTGPITGPITGPGAALILATHYRIGTAQARIGFPEVKYGLTPGGGSTQRLPRLIGAERALSLMLGGRALDAHAAREAGLIDGIVSSDPVAAGVTLAQMLVAQGTKPRRSAALTEHTTDGPRWIAAVAERRKALAAAPITAVHQIIACIEAALLLPFPTGTAFEADAQALCRADPQSKALAHIARAEARAPATLILRDGARRIAAAPLGTAIVEALRKAEQIARRSLRAEGLTDPQIDAALTAYAQRPGHDANGIARRHIAALMLQGARLIEAGAVANAGEIDALAVHAMGFPRWRGGPMKAAHLAGLTGLRREMDLWAGTDPFWTVPQTVIRAARLADGFEAL